jgi:hypothetical protein
MVGAYVTGEGSHGVNLVQQTVVWLTWILGNLRPWCMFRLLSNFSFLRWTWWELIVDKVGGALTSDAIAWFANEALPSLHIRYGLNLWNTETKTIRTFARSKKITIHEPVSSLWFKLTAYLFKKISYTATITSSR